MRPNRRATSLGNEAPSNLTQFLRIKKQKVIFFSRYKGRDLLKVPTLVLFYKFGTCTSTHTKQRLKSSLIETISQRQNIAAYHMFLRPVIRRVIPKNLVIADAVDQWQYIADMTQAVEDADSPEKKTW